MIVVLIKTNTANRLKLITVGVGFSFGNPIIQKDEYLLFLSHLSKTNRQPLQCKKGFHLTASAQNYVGNKLATM